MVQYIINPWPARRELFKVRDEFYPPTTTTSEAANGGRRHAVALVSVWMQRGACPHLVESTALLTSAILDDIPGATAYSVRATYSTAICRFVTGLLDGFQDKKRKQSMYSIAKDIGLPATFVELRHQATHEELPALPKFRSAARKAMLWIWDYYWRDLQEGENDGEISGLVELKRETKRVSTASGESENGDKGAISALAERQRSAVQMREQLGKPRMLVQGAGDMDMDLDDAKGQGGQLPITKDKLRGWTPWEGPWTPTPIGVVRDVA